MFKYIHQILVFIIELLMIGSFAYFGFQNGGTTLAKYILGITIPLIAIFLWGYWAAPKSSNQLSMPYLALFRVIMFLIASYLLYQCNQTKFAIALAILSIITQVISYFEEY